MSDGEEFEWVEGEEDSSGGEFYVTIELTYRGKFSSPTEAEQYGRKKRAQLKKRGDVCGMSLGRIGVLRQG